MAKNELSSELRAGIPAAALWVFKLALRLMLVFGSLGALLNPVAAYLWPKTAFGFSLPLSFSVSARTTDPKLSRSLYQHLTEWPPVTVDTGHYHILPTQFPLAEYWAAVIGTSLLYLALAYACWLLLSIVGSLPRPFILANASRILSLGWLCLGVNVFNGLAGLYLWARLRDLINAGTLPSPLKLIGSTATDIDAAGLVSEAYVPWTLVFGMFVLALIFRIGVQHRENEQRLQIEQELTV